MDQSQLNALLRGRQSVPPWDDAETARRKLKETLEVAERGEGMADSHRNVDVTTIYTEEDNQEAVVAMMGGG